MFYGKQSCLFLLYILTCCIGDTIELSHISNLSPCHWLCIYFPLTHRLIGLVICVYIHCHSDMTRDESYTCSLISLPAALSLDCFTISKVPLHQILNCLSKTVSRSKYSTIMTVKVLVGVVHVWSCNSQCYNGFSPLPASRRQSTGYMMTKPKPSRSRSIADASHLVSDAVPRCTCPQHHHAMATTSRVNYLEVPTYQSKPSEVSFNILSKQLMNPGGWTLLLTPVEKYFVST